MPRQTNYAYCALLISLSVALLPAQTPGATLRGTVTGASGSPAAGIGLVVTDTATGMDVRQIETDGGGRYAAPDLAPGVYKITIEQRGYQTYVADDIVLDPGQVRIVNPKLPAGGPEDTPAIHIGAASTDTQSGTIRDLIENPLRWNEAPSVDKIPSPLPLLTTTPGVQGNGRGLVLSGVSNRNVQTWAMDGISDDAATVFFGNPNYFETVSVVTADPGVDAARPVGYDLVSKRGASGFHGAGYFRFETSKLDARPYFSTQQNHYSLDEAEGEAGGEIFKQRTYFFGGWMHQSNPYNVDLFADVPTAQMRVRDFSQFLSTSTSPTGKVVVLRDPRNGGVPFAGNIIPTTRVNAVVTNLLNNYLPSPTLGDANTFVQNYSWNHPYGPEVYRGNWPFLRLDHKLFDGNNLAFRFVETAFTSVAAGTIGEALDSTQGIKYKNFGVSDTWALSSRVVNRATVGYTGNYVRQGQGVGNVTPLTGDSVLTTMGIQGTNLNGYTTAGFPSISISGMTGLSTVYQGGYTNNVAQNDHNVTLEDAVTWSTGRHSFKLGVQGTHFNWLLGAMPQNNWGSFAFTGQFTGIGFADLMLGLPATSTRVLSPKLNDQLRQNQAGAYIADSFRLTSRLTVDYGVRWDYFGSPRYDDGYMYSWDPATGDVLVAPGTLSSVSSLYPKSIKVMVGQVVPKAKTSNFRPRVSAAYRLSDNLVLRGGYGEFTVPDGYGANGLINDPDGPFRLTETYVNGIASNGVPAYSFPKAFPTTPTSTLVSTQSITALPAQADEGVIRQYNLTVERSFGGLAVRGSYIGSRGSGMNYDLNINKPQASSAAFAASRLPYPQFNAVVATRTDGQWHYDSLQAQVQKRAGGVTFDSSFTWANNISNYANTYDPYNVTDQWTRDASDRRLYFVTAARWAIPTGKGQRWLSGAGPAADRVLSGWTLQAIGTLASGQYYSPLFTGADPANATSGFVTALPDCVGNPNSGAQTINQWFNPAAFAAPPASAGRYGTCGMNILEGYPIHVAHVSLAKRIPLKEWLTATLAVQVSNVTNTPHFTIPNNNISNAGAGMFTASSAVAYYYPERQGSRQVDLKLRLQW